MLFLITSLVDFGFWFRLYCFSFLARVQCLIQVFFHLCCSLDFHLFNFYRIIFSPKGFWFLIPSAAVWSYIALVHFLLWFSSDFYRKYLRQRALWNISKAFSFLSLCLCVCVYLQVIAIVFYLITRGKWYHNRHSLSLKLCGQVERNLIFLVGY